MRKLSAIGILITAVIITAGLIIFKPAPKQIPFERPVSQVEIIEAYPETVQLMIESQGTLLPRTESDLSAEVSGRIIEVSDNFRAGGHFQKGELLVKIDPADYEAFLAGAEADLARARLALYQEQARSQQAEADWALLGQGEASDLTLRKPQLLQAEAIVKSAAASLKRAQRDLNRTQVRAPFDGQILRTYADLGQYISVAPTMPIARIFAVDRAEIRLPITGDEAELLETGEPSGQLVSLSQHRTDSSDPKTWVAQLVRLEATIDPASRLLYAVAELDRPFSSNEPHPKPLRRGQFLHAKIEARRISDAYRIPRYALRGSNTVYVVTENGTAITRTVSIIKSDVKEAIITEGLHPGERIIISPIAYYVEGMPVEIIGRPPGPGDIAHPNPQSAAPKTLHPN